VLCNPFLDFGHFANPFLFLFRLLAFCLADNPAEWTYAWATESFFALATETIKHATCFAMHPVCSAGMTLWTNGHFYFPFTALAVDCSCEQVDVLLSGEAVNLRKSYPPNLLQLPDQALLLLGGSEFLSCTTLLPH
jgi:hypothetical protein